MPPRMDGRMGVYWTTLSHLQAPALQCRSPFSAPRSQASHMRCAMHARVRAGGRRTDVVTPKAQIAASIHRHKVYGQTDTELKDISRLRWQAPPRWSCIEQLTGRVHNDCCMCYGTISVRPCSFGTTHALVQVAELQPWIEMYDPVVDASVTGGMNRYR